MSEHTLEDQLAESMADAAAGNPGKPWEQMRAEVALERARAEYAALAAGLDAVVAAYERKLASWRAYANGLDAEWRAELARADAAEAQLAVLWRVKAAADDLFMRTGVDSIPAAVMREMAEALDAADKLPDAAQHPCRDYDDPHIEAVERQTEAQLVQAREDGARSMADYLDGFLGPIGVVERLAEWRTT